MLSPRLPYQKSKGISRTTIKTKAPSPSQTPFIGNAGIKISMREDHLGQMSRYLAQQHLHGLLSDSQ